ncbi:hypothetical protein [Cryptosporidium parvum Iowa II]|uniref:Uncharacterized protein n=2 Tax=Cryptosporidium parvum TaxID=5807 RepID=Q5CSL2_CRYPI|nr:hypothetical protein [Cryptosporidium parvum Iowa II]EAK88385.1 hypothetical protein cgd1_2210 [Cryptosporidium parvum Iowa II]QOY43407.1 Uncharacterized protein CPATCC_0037140 [Cryptosporidium parvum]WKS76121.1 hypothetical protein CPCDC_1g2210 [Cryptosporidium sp. 43IA8]WRK30613.1 Uncharacterized protein cpbgf_1002210 [Cryptosporidium parvum]|eukprot:QOY43407.1 hypothetical protein CPATCC_000189 [Cryptosporidium parvum]
MLLVDRISNLEEKVNEQNEAIKKIALYTLEILDENDRLWKHIMKDITMKHNRSSPQNINEHIFRFRSKTPPPLKEPNLPEKEQSFKVRRGTEKFNNDVFLSILTKEIGQKKVFPKNGKK